MSCTGYIIPKLCSTRSVLLYLTCVINVKTLWEAWQTLFFSDLPLHENLNQSMEKKENKEEKNIGKQNKNSNRGMWNWWVWKITSFCFSVFLCSQPVRSVAKLTACVKHMASPVSPCSPSSHRSLVFHQK